MTSNQTHVNKDTIEAAIPAPKEPNTLLVIIVFDF